MTEQCEMCDADAEANKHLWFNNWLCLKCAIELDELLEVET